MAKPLQIVQRKDGLFQLVQGSKVLFVGSYLECLQEKSIAEQYPTE